MALSEKELSIPVDSISHFDLIIHPSDGVETSHDSLEHDVEILKL